MRILRVLPFLCSGLFLGGIVFHPLSAKGTEADFSWPDLKACESETYMETESETEFLTDLEDIQNTPKQLNIHDLTDETLNRLFGNMPHYLDLGSFALNRLNGLKTPRITSYGVVFDGPGNTVYIQRFSWNVLQQRITSIISDKQGDWSVYLKDLKTGDTMEINEHAMQSASLIKLFIAGTTLERIESGELTETETISHALHEMITVSDNESSNVLVRSFYDENGSFQDGLDIVNDFIRRYGFSNTQQVNGIADPSLWVSDGSVNETSPADCGKLLELIYDRKLVSHYASYRFENLLNNQEVNYKIPAALPEGTHISHKTGEVDNTENDAAIIYTPYGDYIFCIMSTELTDTRSAVDTIHEVTKLIYNWYTKPLVRADAKTLQPLDSSRTDT